MAPRSAWAEKSYTPSSHVRYGSIRSLQGMLDLLKMSSVADQNDVPNMLYAFSAVFIFMPTIAVALRFQARRRIRSSFGWDDWTILIALLSCFAMAILIIIGTAIGGMGRPLKRDAHGSPIYDHEYMIFQRVNYGIDLAQLLALGPTKISVLLLYRQIFGVDKRRFNFISQALIAFVIAWTIAFFFTNAFQYTPVSDMWEKKPTETHATFSHSTDMFLAQSYADVVLDVLIITLPVPLIWKLQMSFKRKLQISAIFLLGAITTGASIARTVVQYGVAREFNSHNVDKTYYLAPIAYWPLIEAALGIVAACLPLFRPIGQIYSVRNLVLVSSKALSSIFTQSSGSSSKLSHGRTHQGEISSTPPSSHDDPSQNDKWLKIYNLSVLHQTVDNETQIESLPESDPSVHSSVGGGITYKKGYEVSYGTKEKGRA